MPKKFVTIICLMTLIFQLLSARSKRVNQIPHGTQFSCETCHTGQGGPRNAFGSQVSNNYLDTNGDVTWGAELAGLEADGDGVTNGAELQDPNGEWQIGDPDPGDATKVTNPGDPNSVGISPLSLNDQPVEFQLKANYPNPFNMSTTLHFTVDQNCYAELDIYNLQGRRIARLRAGNFPPGSYRISWNGRDLTGQPAESGLYFARLKSAQQVTTIKMMLLK